MNDHSAGHKVSRAREFEREATEITQMADRVIEFANQPGNENERAFYLRLATKWLKMAAELAPA